MLGSNSCVDVCLAGMRVQWVHFECIMPTVLTVTTVYWTMLYGA